MMADRYSVLVVTMRRRFGALGCDMRVAKSDDLDPEAARLNGLRVVAQSDGSALWRQVFVDDGEFLIPVAAPEAEEEV